MLVINRRESIDEQYDHKHKSTSKRYNNISKANFDEQSGIDLLSSPRNIIVIEHTHALYKYKSKVWTCRFQAIGD